MCRGKLALQKATAGCKQDYWAANPWSNLHKANDLLASASATTLWGVAVRSGPFKLETWANWEAPPSLFKQQF